MFGWSSCLFLDLVQTCSQEHDNVVVHGGVRLISFFFNLAIVFMTRSRETKQVGCVDG